MAQMELSCRLCLQPTKPVWITKLLNKHSVQYFKCESCKALQTEKPFWLNEAYNSNISSLDTGAVVRNLNNFATCVTLCRLFSIKTSLDYGSGDGLLTRFLRDHNIDAYAYEKYGIPKYAQGYHNPGKKNYELITAFEVFEHFEEPGREIQEIFSLNPNFVLVSTELYTNQNEEWSYLSKESGQHIFFYSAESINYIARSYNYGATNLGNNIIFYNSSLPDIENLIEKIKLLFLGWIFEALKKEILSSPANGFVADNLNLINQYYSQK